MKRRYNKNNLKRKRRTKMRSKIRSKVYKRTKKKRLTKKNKRQQFAGAGESTLTPTQEALKAKALKARKEVGLSESAYDIEVTAERKKRSANSMIERHTDGIQVLLKVNNGHKKCRKLKFEERRDYFYLVFYAVEDDGAETRKESFVCNGLEGDDNIVINRGSTRYEITPVGSCIRSAKYHLPAFMGGIGHRFSDDTSSGVPLVNREKLKENLKLLEEANIEKDELSQYLSNVDSVQSHGY